MRFYTLCLIAICYLAVITKSIDSNTKYYIYNKSTKKCLGRKLVKSIEHIRIDADCNSVIVIIDGI